MRDLKPQQLKDMKAAKELADLISGHCVENSVGDWIWCNLVTIYPYADEDKLKLVLHYTRRITETGRLILSPSSCSVDFESGDLLKGYDARDPEETLDIVDGEIRALPKQVYAYCPNCHTRYAKSWFKQGYATTKEEFERPPDQPGADEITCWNCGTRTYYKRWDFKPAPRSVLAGPLKWYPVKRVQ